MYTRIHVYVVEGRMPLPQSGRPKLSGWKSASVKGFQTMSNLLVNVFSLSLSRVLDPSVHPSIHLSLPLSQSQTICVRMCVGFDSNGLAPLIHWSIR